MELVPASNCDVPVLAAMNKAVIEDEGHRNRMTVNQLAERMQRWLVGEYAAHLFVVENEAVGYCLFKHEPDYVHIRQFFILRDQRRKGYGRLAMRRLAKKIWPQGKRLRLDVLVSNTSGIAFWRACGFEDYCLTMEREGPMPGQTTES